MPFPTDPKPIDGNNQGLLNDSGPNAISNQNESVQTPTSRYPRRERKKPKYLGYDGDNNIDENDNINFTVDYCYNMSDASKTYQEAISSPDSYKWQNAMEEEIQALRENDTFELTPMPEGRKVAGGAIGFMLLKLAPMVKRNIKLVL